MRAYGYVYATLAFGRVLLLYFSGTRAIRNENCGGSCGYRLFI